MITLALRSCLVTPAPPDGIENCQTGVLLAYASRHGHALVDRELYLPERWNR